MATASPKDPRNVKDELVRHVRRTIPETCHDTKLSKAGCQIALTGIDANRVIVDMDCTKSS